MPKILLLGASGLLGSAFKDYFKSKSIEFSAPSRADLDLLQELEVANVIKQGKYDLVINATGYNSVDKAEESKEEALLCGKLNVGVPLLLAKSIADSSPETRLLHFSSDYVFDGENKNGYNESAQVNPLSVYGLSKADSEQAVLGNCKNALVVRISWLFGPNKGNFVQKIIDKYEEAENPLEIVDSAFGKPTYTCDVVEAVMSNWGHLEAGIYHLPNESVMSWYELAKYSLDKKFKESNIVPCKEFISLAKRPKYSILLNEKLPKLRSGFEAIDDYLSK